MKFLALTCALGWVSGCAIVDSTIQVDHEQAAAAVHARSPQRFSLATIRAVQGQDASRDGVKKNGFGAETASVRTEPKTEEIVSRALTVELRAAGFEIDSAAPAAITVEIRQFFVEPEVGLFAGDVYAVIDATVTVALDQQRTFKRRFTGIGKTTTMIWSDHFYQEAIRDALDDFVKKSVPAIVTLADGGGVT